MSHASPPRPRRRGASRALALVPPLVLMLAACGGVQTAACGLVEFGSDIQADLESVLALDPAAVAVPGSPEQTSALAAVDTAEATVATAQEALDNATEDQVGPVIGTLFQAALDATSAAISALRGAIESGDADAVADAMVSVQSASDAFDAFEASVADSNVDCPDASAAPSMSAAASAAPSATAVATPEPTAEPTTTLPLPPRSRPAAGWPTSSLRLLA